MPAVSPICSDPSYVDPLDADRFDSDPIDSDPVSDCRSVVDELAELGWKLNANQFRVVHLAARYDEELEWFHCGFRSSPAALAKRLQIQPGTAREWVRVGYLLRELPLIDAAFAANQMSYAKVRILTRWADPENEAQLLALAERRSAGRLSGAIAKALADSDDDQDARDARHRDARSFTSYTDGDGMVIIRLALPPLIAKWILTAIEQLVRQIAKIPLDDTTPTDTDPSDTGPFDTDASCGRTVTNARETVTCGEGDPSAVASGGRTAVDAPESATRRGGCRPGEASAATEPPLPATLAELKRWQVGSDDGWMPTMAQQRADAFVALFLRLDVDLTTEVVIHVRGDGNTFDDGTPLTDNAIVGRLDESFIRLLIHDAERRPVNASSRRRFPTVRQQRVAQEAHNHECVDCSATDLLEFDHVPPYHQTRRTITNELELRCAPCHRARHRATTRPPAHD